MSRESVDVTAVGPQRVDERRGDDHPVRAGPGDGPDVGLTAHAEADRDGDRRRGLDRRDEAADR